MGIGVLGPLTVDGDTGVVGPRDRVVLGALVVGAGEAVSTSMLTDALWGDAPPASAGKVVQGCIARLRKQLGATAIETVPGGYRLAVPEDRLDARRFERRVARCRELLSLGDADRAAFVVDEALDLWRGPALTDLDGWAPGRIEADRLEQLRLDAEEMRLEARLRAGRFREVLADAQAGVAAAPLRERRWALLALAQYQAGRQGDALDTLRRARRRLADDLGLDPGPELVGLESAILRQDPSLVADILPEPSGTCPYLGLIPYDVGDADAFFGRERDVAACLRRLHAQGVLVVVGPSGSGKSSLVRAGIAATIEHDGGRAAVITPGAHPMAALTAVSLVGGAVLVVDQCEEAVTLCRDPDEQAQFFTALADHARDRKLVVALRADRLGAVPAHAPFARLVERGLYLLGRLDSDDLRSSIEGPARQAGLLLEAGLVDLLLRDVEGEPGALPLLSHALRETWERREGRTLTVDAYRASGGIRGAVAKSAEHVYEQADPAQRPILRDLLLRLVAPSPEGEPVRTRVPRRQVVGGSEHEQVIEQLVRARLVTSDQDVIELAHEALARAWPRLRGWLDDDVEGQRIWRHLASAADAWQGMGQPDSELYRGVRLARVLEWRDSTAPDLNPTEEAFLAASHHRADEEHRSAARRRRSVIAVLVIVIVATTGLATVASVNQQRAARAADVARARELTAAAVVSLESDPALAKLLALAAAEMAEPSVDTLATLHRAIAEDRVVARYRWPDELEVRQLTTSLHPDGTRLVASGTHVGPSRHLEVFDLERDEVVWRWDSGDAAAVIDRPMFSPDGASVVAGVLWEPDDQRERELPRDRLGALVWDADTGELVRRLDLGPCGGMVLGMAGSVVLAQTRPDTDAPTCWTTPPGSPLAAELVDVRTGARQVISPDSWGREGTLSGDGRRVAVTEDTDDGPSTSVYDTATGNRVLAFDPLAQGGHLDEVVRALNHDGTLLATGYQPITIWDVASGDRLTMFRGHAGEAVPVFATEETVLSAGVDGTLRSWHARTGEELAVHRAVGAGLWPSPAANGRVLVADPATVSATLVDTNPHRELWGVDTCPGFVWAQTLRVAADRAALSVTCDDDETHTYIVDLITRQPVHVLPGHRAQDLALSPDGLHLVRQEGAAPDGRADDGSWFGPPAVRTLATGELVTTFDQVCTWSAADPEGLDPGEQPGCGDFPDAPFWLWNWGMAWSPDSALVVVGDERVGAVAWDADSGDLVARMDVCGRLVQGLLFAPAGDELFLFCNPEGHVVAVSTDTWEELRRAELDPTVEARGSMALAGFTPDGRYILGVGGAFFHGGVGLLHWIDVDTLEIEHTLPRIHDATPKSWAMSPDGTLLATGASDGYARVWDVVDRSLVHEIRVGDTQVQGVAFVGDHHLAVAPEQGGVQVFTLDPDELLDLARASLTRGFTSTECSRLGFEVCPTLSEMRREVAASGR